MERGEGESWSGDINKSNWADGPWKAEPDRATFRDEESGYVCVLQRSPNVGVWSGYVGMGENHPLFKEEGIPCGLLHVYGGITYCGFGDDFRVSLVDPGVTRWWVGFDCWHAGDIFPGCWRVPLDAYPSDHIYRDINYVRAEVKSLAKQLKEIEEVQAAIKKGESDE